MGFLDMFGKGGGKVSIELPSNAGRCGDKLTGTVIFTAGKREQKIAGFKVWFVKKKDPGEQGGDEQLWAPEKFAVPEGTTIKAGEVKKFPFETKVPLVGVSRVNGQLFPYVMKASMSIPKEVDPEGETGVTIDGGGELTIG